MKKVKHKRNKMPHEKAMLKQLIDADMRVQDVANFYGVNPANVCARMLRNDTQYIEHAIREVKAARANNRKSA